MVTVKHTETNQFGCDNIEEKIICSKNQEFKKNAKMSTNKCIKSYTHTKYIDPLSMKFKMLCRTVVKFPLIFNTHRKYCFKLFRSTRNPKKNWYGAHFFSIFFFYHRVCDIVCEIFKVFVSFVWCWMILCERKKKKTEHVADVMPNIMEYHEANY